MEALSPILTAWARAPALGPRKAWSVFAALFGKGRSRDGARAAPAASSAGDPAEARRFRELMLPHLDAAYNFARYLTRDAAAAEDVVQEAYLRALRAFPGYRGGEPKAWLLSIVRNCAFTWSRAERGRAARTTGSLNFGDGDEDANGGAAAETLADPDQETPETALVRQVDIAAVREAVAALPEPFRQTLVLRELEELSYKEVAAATSAPIGTVMSRLARARAMLAEALAQGPAQAQPQAGDRP